MVHDDEPVAELLGLVHVVRREHEGHALLLEPEQPVPDHVPRLRVEPGRRLVEQQQVGVVDQRAGDREPPLHAARERLDLVAGALGQLDEVEQLVDPRLQLAPREPEVAAVDEQVLADGQLDVEGVLLRDDAEPGPDLRARRVAGSRPRMRSVPPLTGETQPIIRIVELLPAPFGPRKPNASPALDVEVDAVDGDEVAEALDEPAGVDHGAVLAHGAQPTYAGRTAFRVASTSRAIWSISSCSLSKTCSSRSRSHSSTTRRRP